MRRAVGIDIGATNLKTGIVNALGEVSRVAVTPVSTKERTEEGMVDTLAELCGRVKSQADVGAVGIGIPGAIAAGAVVTQAPNFPLWDNFAIRDRLQQRVGVPVFVENDANAVALGELRAGAAKGVEDYLCITLGTGVGGGLVLGGRLWHGANGMAAEFGHIIVEPEGHPCGCGGHGCVEQYASQVGLRRFVQAHGRQLPQLDPDDPDLPRKLAQMATDGNETAAAAFRRLACYLGIAIACVVSLLNIKLFVICGGLSQSLDLYREPMMAEIRSRTFKAMGRDVTVKPGILGEQAGIIGAASLAFQ